VRCYDADPKMVAAARRTIERNAARATVTNAVLTNEPAAPPTTGFYVRPDFWLSSLAPHPEATRIDVPLLDLATEITAHDASYLIVDIEGAETDLLRTPLPASVRKICVECHPAVSGREDVRALLSSLLDQGFALDLELSRPPVLFLDR
jgi:FkbM family methyltransferase